MEHEADITTAIEGDVCVVAVRGEHDIATAPALRAALEAAVEKHEHLLIDLTPATFIDSTVLGVLLGARQQAQDRSSGYSVLLGTEGDAAVQRIIEVTGLAPILPVHHERESALAGARSR